MKSSIPFLRIVVIGDNAAGKTTLIHRYVQNEFNTRVQTTISAGFTLHYLDNPAATLQIWDTAGQDRLRPNFYSTHSQKVLQRANTLMVVCDVTDLDSFHNIKTHLAEARPHLPDTIHIILVGTKSDLASEPCVSNDMLRLLAQQCECDYVITSARDQASVDHLFLAAINRWVPQQALPTVTPTPTIPDSGFLQTHWRALLASSVILLALTIVALLSYSPGLLTTVSFPTNTLLAGMLGIVCACSLPVALFLKMKNQRENLPETLSHPTAQTNRSTRLIEDGLGVSRQTARTTAPQTGRIIKPMPLRMRPQIHAVAENDRQVLRPS